MDYKKVRRLDLYDAGIVISDTQDGGVFSDCDFPGFRLNIDGDKFAKTFDLPFYPYRIIGRKRLYWTEIALVRDIRWYTDEMSCEVDSIFAKIDSGLLHVCVFQNWEGEEKLTAHEFTYSGRFTVEWAYEWD